MTSEPVTRTRSGYGIPNVEKPHSVMSPILSHIRQLGAAHIKDIVMSGPTRYHTNNWMPGWV